MTVSVFQRFSSLLLERVLGQNGAWKFLLLESNYVILERVPIFWQPLLWKSLPVKYPHFSSHTSMQTIVMLNQLRIKHYSHEVELTSFLPDDTTKGVAEHSLRLQPSINLHIPVGVAEHSFRLQPSINLHVPVTGSAVLVPIVLPCKDEDSGIGPVQRSKLHIILAPTQNSNPGGRIQNH